VISSELIRHISGEKDKPIRFPFSVELCVIWVTDEGTFLWITIFFKVEARRGIV
jgi:hypothetical protein